MRGDVGAQGVSDIPIDLSKLDGIEWVTGSHDPETERKACVMNAVAYVTGEPFTDRPKCADPSITAACICAWDNSNDKIRAQLVKMIPDIVGTSSIPPARLRYHWANVAVRVIAPMALDNAGLHEEAEKLRALPVIDSQGSAWSAAESASASASKWASKWAAESAARSALRSAESAESAEMAGVWDTFLTASESAESEESAAGRSAGKSAWSAERAGVWDTFLTAIREACAMKEV